MISMPATYPVTAHTDYVGPGSTFVVIQGFDHNGCAHIPAALEKGATTIVVDQELSPETVRFIHTYYAQIKKVYAARSALAQLSAQASGYAHKQLKLIGITGTKGKTTTAHILFHLLKSSGIQAALLSSVHNAIGDDLLPANLTTPQPDYLHQFFNLAVAQGIEWVVMEVAAQAISLQRIEGLQFDAVLMTNVAREHLEFYDSMEEYYADKYKLLSYRKPSAPAWINKDDARLASINTDHVHWFSCVQPCELAGTLRPTHDVTLKADIQYQNQVHPIRCATVSGRYNLSNVLAAIGAAHTVGLSFKDITDAIARFPGIAGRQEQYQLPNGARVIIDYAHNPLSFYAFFETIAPLTQQLIVVFGAGGDRDRGRRPEMGEIASHYAQLIILTTDNPRSEDPARIAADIMEGIHPMRRDAVVYEPDREKAIQKAYAYSQKGSIIALLGKGPDTYQLIGNQKIPFSERAIVLQLCRQKAHSDLKKGGNLIG